MIARSVVGIGVLCCSISVTAEDEIPDPALLEWLGQFAELEERDFDMNDLLDALLETDGMETDGSQESPQETSQ